MHVDEIVANVNNWYSAHQHYTDEAQKAKTVPSVVKIAVCMNGRKSYFMETK
jgi:hypothetical protein